MSPPSAPEPLLVVDGLTVSFATATAPLRVVEDVGFEVEAGRTLGLVGESGSGKSVSSLAIMGLIPPTSGQVSARTLRFEGRDLADLKPAEMRRLRGNDMSMIFQEPMTSLNPAFTVGNQIAEAVRIHQGGSRKAARSRAAEMLDRVGIPDAHRRVNDYPHAFSGGMRQRAMIAMALANDPKLLIADEPTTALDVTIQAQILDLIRTLQSDLGMAVIFVTHDLGVVADICDEVVVMYAGQVAERAEVHDLFRRPHHPYSEGLLASMPQVAVPGEPLPVIPGVVPRPDEYPAGCRFAARCTYTEDVCRSAPPELVAVGDRTAGARSLSRCVRHGDLGLSGSRWEPATATGPDPTAVRDAPAPLLRVSDLRKEFPVRSSILRRVTGRVRAVDGIDITVGRGETVGLVGESGSGKSTAARLILRLIEPSGGSVVLGGVDIIGASERDLRRARREMQIVFQDPYSSLDPRATIAETVGEPLEVHEHLRGNDRDQRVAELLEAVGLGRHLLRRYPHEFSGGQRQRIAVARALALSPELLVLDEPVSSLDVSTQSQVINLLTDLQDELGLAFLFIAHDLSVVRHISDRIAVMYLGRIVEVGDAEQVYTRPTHPYTEALLSAIPVPDPAEQRGRRRIVLGGDVPSPLSPPAGCRFHPRCPYVMDVCRTEDPPAFDTPVGTRVACHLHRHGPKLAGRTVSFARPAEVAR